MTLEKDTKILIIGLGVIGGGYAAALSKKGYVVKAITKEEKDVAYALSRGMIAEGRAFVDEKLVGEADLVVFAVYPHVFIEWIEKYQHLFKPHALITDVTGVKGAVVERVQSILRSDVEFIAAHPMAGRESSGVEFSDPTVFHDANYIVTPTEKNTPQAVETCKKLGEELGFARISQLSVDKHDETIAFLSQLTHCIAVCLMNAVQSEGLEKYTGDSFRDLTRIAKINDKMWSELFLLNKTALLKETDAFLAEFTAFRDMIENGDEEGIRQKMRSSASRRGLFDKPSVKKEK